MDGAVACCEADGAVGGSGAHQQNFAHGLQKVQRREVPLRREVASAGLGCVDKNDFYRTRVRSLAMLVTHSLTD